MTNEEAFKILNEHTQYFVPTQDLEALEMAMDALSEQKDGKWKFIGIDSMTYTYLFECSECGVYINYPVFSRICGYNFCPHCGADMRESE